MTQGTYEQVVRLAEQLTPREQIALVTHLQHLMQQRELTPAERKTLFATLIADLGPVAPDVSLRREDWYGDDER